MYTILSVNTFSIQQNLTWSDYPLKGLLFLNNKGTILAIFSCVQEKLCTIERFHSRGRQLCIFIGTKESDNMRKRTGLEHQHGRRFILGGDTIMAAVTSCENSLLYEHLSSLRHKTAQKATQQLIRYVTIRFQDRKCSASPRAFKRGMVHLRVLVWNPCGLSSTLPRC